MCGQINYESKPLPKRGKRDAVKKAIPTKEQDKSAAGVGGFGYSR